ncbi:MAG: High-affinity Na(+)/H(+) antiporter NhaS3, partial [Actinomycetota bacterium]
MLAVLAASTDGIDLGRLLLDLTLMLVMAKVAAEIFDRLHIPVVIGEIGVGIVLGPSLLGWVRTGDIVFFLAEIGVIILLAQVGMETDIDELRRVGRSSLSVGMIGVAAPMALGYFAATALGESTNTALFVGAALTATSIGITARVFGDLRALSTPEARTVLGAAVTDDVLGLIILTVVTRIVQQGSVDFATVSSTIGLAIGFLVVAGFIGLVVFPTLLRRIGTLSKSSSTIPVVAIALVLAFSVLADLANLAPIIGAFVAGLGLRKVAVHERIERDLSSLGQIFVPVFFLYIGISTDLAAMLDGRVLLVALILSAIAIVGKLVSAFGALGTTSDKLVIGFGMLPRGEVGLIFATIGLSVGALNDELYGSILVVVLLTTLIAPPLLRWRIGKSTGVESHEPVTPEPPQGWLTVVNKHVQLNGWPPSSALAKIALDAALMVVDARPSSGLLDWFSAHRNSPVTWDRDATDRLVSVLRDGNARSWRFLDTIGFIQRALPELADAMAARASDSTELDPTHALHFPTVEAIASSTHVRDSDSDELVFAAFARDVSDSGSDGMGALRRLDLDLTEMSQIARVIDGSAMLRSVVTTEPMNVDQRLISQLANHLHSPRIVEQCRHLSAARGDFNDRQYGALIEIVAEIQEVLSHPDLMQSETNTVLESRLNAAKALTTDT